MNAITNASMHRLRDDGEIAEMLSYLDAMPISIYGLDRDEYLETTRRDKYQDMLDGIVRLLRIGGPEKIVLQTRQLKKREPDFVAGWLGALADRAGVDANRIRIFYGMTQYANWGVFDTSKPLPHDATWVGRLENHGQCALPLASAQIYSNGNVSLCACADFNGDGALNIGNINEQSLAEMLSTEKVRRFWDWEANGIPEVCRKCSFYRPMSIYRDVPAAIADPNGVFNGYA